MGLKTMKYEDWVEKYRPYMNKNGYPEDYHPKVIEGDDVMVEAAKLAWKENRIWTTINGDDDIFIENGIHIVNRIDYHITAVPFKKGETIQIEY